MNIADITTRRLTIPLKKPFKTALRTVEAAQTLVVCVISDSGQAGWGEAPPTMAITGETLESAEAFIAAARPRLIGQNLAAYENVFHILDRLAARNSSAKAAIDMALHDLIAQSCRLPLYQLLGGYRDELETDMTVSVNAPEEMGEDAAQFVRSGFTVLKIKVGMGEIRQDIERVREIRKRVGSGIKLRLDVNQGWEAKEAVRAIRYMEDQGFDIELVEQPVPAGDLDGLKRVTDSVDTLIMADESVFSPADAFEVLRRRAADLINIKLMKAGGIRHAETIVRMCEACGVACMMGSMLESRIGITAAAHLAASKRNVTRFDLDAPLMMKHDPVIGGVQLEGRKLKLTPGPGLGIHGVE